ncbi:MAG: helix-turn-helix domain-containing protein, partial [Parafilimonas sp.]
KQDHQFLLEQLYYAKGVTEMADLVNAWLLQYLNKQNHVDYKDRITAAANLIIKKAGLISMNHLACYINMSIRSFERHFNEEIGISPKHLCCITRFNHALELKLRKPNIDWTFIAHQCGYFDQTHLIKDFKRFCGNAPASLLKHVPLLEESYTSRINAL